MGQDVRGADVVVLAGDADLAQIGRSAPAAAVVVHGNGLEARCKEIYERLLFPRARIVGIADADSVSSAVRSIAFELDEAHDVIAMRDGSFGPCSARLGRGGIREFV